MMAQSTPHRGKKRALNESSISSISLPTNVDSWHFGKVSESEVLSCFSPGQESECHHTATENTCYLPRHEMDMGSYHGYLQCSINSSVPAVVIVNTGPVCKHHVLLVPHVGEKLPQQLTQDALALGIAFGVRASPHMRLSFNSIGAGASVNHLHFQGFFALPTPEDKFPFERYLRSGGMTESRGPSMAPSGPIMISSTKGWPLRGWIFTWVDENVFSIDSSLMEQRFAELIFRFVKRLQGWNIAHNILVLEGGTSVAVFPRRISNSQGMDVSQLQVSGHELLGWWIVPDEQDFTKMDENSAVTLLRSMALPVEVERQLWSALRSDGWQIIESELDPPAQEETIISE